MSVIIFSEKIKEKCSNYLFIIFEIIWNFETLRSRRKYSARVHLAPCEILATPIIVDKDRRQVSPSEMAVIVCGIDR